MRTCALEETNKCFSYCLNWAWTALRCANRKRGQYQVPTPTFCYFLSLLFKVLKYWWKFLLCQCLSSKSSDQTSVSFPSVEVCLPVCLYFTIDG